MQLSLQYSSRSTRFTHFDSTPIFSFFVVKIGSLFEKKRTNNMSNLMIRRVDFFFFAIVSNWKQFRFGLNIIHILHTLSYLCIFVYSSQLLLWSGGQAVADAMPDLLEEARVRKQKSVAMCALTAAWAVRQVQI